MAHERVVGRDGAVGVEPKDAADARDRRRAGVLLEARVAQKATIQVARDSVKFAVRTKQNHAPVVVGTVVLRGVAGERHN
jgi:hypothetical protein